LEVAQANGKQGVSGEQDALLGLIRKMRDETTTELHLYSRLSHGSSAFGLMQQKAMTAGQQPCLNSDIKWAWSFKKT
jgi:hypothetical protein